MYGIFTYIWLILIANVGKYTIHGSYAILSPIFFGMILLLFFFSEPHAIFMPPKTSMSTGVFCCLFSILYLGPRQHYCNSSKHLLATWKEVSMKMLINYQLLSTSMNPPTIKSTVFLPQEKNVCISINLKPVKPAIQLPKQWDTMLYSESGDQLITLYACMYAYIYNIFACQLITLHETIHENQDLLFEHSVLDFICISLFSTPSTICAIPRHQTRGDHTSLIS